MNSISIIIPVLNEAKNIEALLTYLDLNSSSKSISEILVVDGGSSDGTQAIISEFSKKHPQLFNRISNVQIASYLGVTPEFLSTIRKNISKS